MAVSQHLSGNVHEDAEAGYGAEGVGNGFGKVNSVHIEEYGQDEGQRSQQYHLSEAGKEQTGLGVTYAKQACLSTHLKSEYHHTADEYGQLLGAQSREGGIGSEYPREKRDYNTFIIIFFNCTS